MVSPRRLLLLLGAAVVLQQASPQSVARADSTQLANELEMRALLGFSVDPAFVAVLDGNPVASREYGIPMTEGEIAELQRRLVIQHQMTGLYGRLQKLGSGFGGMYLDQRAGGIVDIAITAESPVDAKEIETWASDGMTIRVRTVARSERTLDAIYREASFDMEEWRRGGIDILSVGVDIVHNGLDFGLGSIGDYAAEQLAARYGDDVVRLHQEEPIGLTSCPYRDNCPGPPWMAGLVIEKPDGTRHCASGFIVRYGTDTQMLTAGHCYGFGQAVTMHHGYSIGTVQKRSWYDYATSDSERIQMSNANESNIVWAGLHITTEDLTFVGDWVCRSAPVTNVICGSVTNASYTHYYPPPDSIHIMYAAKYYSAGHGAQQGDSGSPIYSAAGSDFAANGILSGGDGDSGGGTTIFTKIDWIDSYLGTSTCVDMACVY